MAEDVKVVDEVVEEVKPRGREGLLAMMRGHRGDDYAAADDEAFLDDVHGHVQGLNEELGGYRDSHGRIAEAIRRDPRAGAFFSALVNDEKPESFQGAFGRIFGKEALEGDPEFEKGYQERLRLEEEARGRALKSQEEYAGSLERFARDNGLSEEDRAGLHDEVMDLVTGVLDGTLPADIVEMVYRGRRYDADVKAAAEAGAAEGRNERIRERLRTPEGALPDLGGRSGQATAPTGTEGEAARKRGSVYEDIKEVGG